MPAELENNLLSLFALSFASLKEIEGNTLSEKIKSIFSGALIRIRSIDWNDFKELRKRRDAILHSL